MALPRISGRDFECALSDAHGLRGDANSAAGEQFESDLESLAFFAEAIPFRYFAIGKSNFGRTRSP